MDVTPNLEELSDGALKDLIKDLNTEELEISYRRRLLHGRIELLKTELVRRLRTKGHSELSTVDVDSLSKILARRLPEVAELERTESE